MFYRYELLNRVKLNHILNVFDSGDWEDGSKSGSKEKKLKDNIQLCKEHSHACWQLFEEEYTNHSIVNGSLVTVAYTLPNFCRYGVGSHYDWHVDYAYMGGDCRLRSDISTTVFLNDPEEYEGGVLELKFGTEVFEIKLAAGWAFSYPTGIQHRVTPITSGERKVAVLWSQSKFKDPMDRLTYANMVETSNKYNITSPDHPGWELQSSLDNAKMHFLRSKGDV